MARLDVNAGLSMPDELFIGAHCDSASPPKNPTGESVLNTKS